MMITCQNSGAAKYIGIGYILTISMWMGTYAVTDFLKRRHRYWRSLKMVFVKLKCLEVQQKPKVKNETPPEAQTLIAPSKTLENFDFDKEELEILKDQLRAKNYIVIDNDGGGDC